jgi:peroxidase
MFYHQWLRPSPEQPFRAIRRTGRHPRKKTRTWLRLEGLEERCLLDGTGYQPITEIGNNLANPSWGTAYTDLLRIEAAAYADGISAPSLAQDQSARAISNILNNQADPNNPSQDISTVDLQSLSDFGYVWGQFIDHDMDLTPATSGESFPIPADTADPIGTESFTRSLYDPNTGTDPSNPRQQTNVATSFLDLSQVYGSDAVTADALRTHVGGLLKTSPGNMLPYYSSLYFTAPELAALHMADDAGAVSTDQLFVTGDVRGNENIELTALQTLFVRNHNRLASLLQAEHPNWTDDQLYQEARKLNIAEEQMITYNEWIPAVLGSNALPAYTGYDPTVNAGITTEFSTVGFRFGHSLLSANIERQGNNGLDINVSGGASINLAQDFFDPNLLNTNGVVDPLTGQISSDIDAILKGDADGISQAMDLLAIGQVRNLLFGNGEFGGQDLIARDIQRARDHGIGSYNDLRTAYGLPPVTSFAQITRNIQVQQELQQAYGSVDNIDPFEGGLAEDHVPGSDVGPLFQAIMVDQFTRLRNGDRFFYLNEHFSPDELNLLQQGTLAKVIESNTSITNLQSDVFLFTASINGTVYADPGRDHRAGVAGIVVQLQDDSGNLLATTTTDSSGHYRFDQQSGMSATGYYTVSLVLPDGMTQTTRSPGAMLISRGDMSLSGVNFGVARSGHSGDFGAGGHFGGGPGGGASADAPSGSQSAEQPAQSPATLSSSSQPSLPSSAQNSGPTDSNHAVAKESVSENNPVADFLVGDESFAPL